MQRNYDVIIVGAGPAGATLAYELAYKGIRVLVLEKARLPRYKCCAGGLTVKAAKLLGEDIAVEVEDTISRAVITFAGSSPYLRNFGNAIMYTIRRDNFDYALVKRAQGVGANIVQGLAVSGVELSQTGVEVSTIAGNFHSQIIAGADGVRSIVARSMGMETNNTYVVGIETEVQVPEEELARWKSQLAIDLGHIHAGYSWVFPKADHLSIGVANLASKVKDLKRKYWEFMNFLNLRSYTINRWESSLIPVCSEKTLVARGKAILLGDAAGLADPLTGEGIYNAIFSAQLATPAIEKSLSSGEVVLDDYSKSVEEKIVSEMKIAYMFSRVLAPIPSRLFKILNQDERVWRTCCHLLRGETDYSTIKNKIGSIGGLYNLIFQR